MTTLCFKGTLYFNWGYSHVRSRFFTNGRSHLQTLVWKLWFDQKCHTLPMHYFISDKFKLPKLLQKHHWSFFTPRSLTEGNFCSRVSGNACPIVLHCHQAVCPLVFPKSIHLQCLHLLWSLSPQWISFQLNIKVKMTKKIHSHSMKIGWIVKRQLN